MNLLFCEEATGYKHTLSLFSLTAAASSDDVFVSICISICICIFIFIWIHCFVRKRFYRHTSSLFRLTRAASLDDVFGISSSFRFVYHWPRYFRWSFWLLSSSSLRFVYHWPQYFWWSIWLFSSFQICLLLPSMFWMPKLWWL